LRDYNASGHIALTYGCYPPVTKIACLNMRYVPNLLPQPSKVLPDYFRGSIYKPAKRNTFVAIILWLLGIFFLLSALAYLNHPLQFLVFGLLGFILIPPGHRFLERMLRFRLTPKIKTITTSALFIGSLPLVDHYNEINRQQVLLQKQLDEKAAKEKAIAEQKAQQRKDSLAYYIQQSNQLAAAHKFDVAEQQLQLAQSFAANKADSDQVLDGKITIESVKAIDKVKAGKYEDALYDIGSLLAIHPSNQELRYYKALCKSKTDDVQGAVTELKPLVEAGYAPAIALHDKINPLRKHVAYYVTRCCDGSSSDAKGSGACSHHGGVCNWNEPVYEESRKYE